MSHETNEKICEAAYEAGFDKGFKEGCEKTLDRVISKLKKLYPDLICETIEIGE